MLVEVAVVAVVDFQLSQANQAVSVLAQHKIIPLPTLDLCSVVAEGQPAHSVRQHPYSANLPNLSNSSSNNYNNKAHSEHYKVNPHPSLANPPNNHKVHSVHYSPNPHNHNPHSVHRKRNLNPPSAPYKVNLSPLLVVGRMQIR
jgi:hypothetical protein